MILVGRQSACCLIGSDRLAGWFLRLQAMLPELIELIAAAQDHDAIAGLQDLVPRRGEVDPSVGPLDRHDDHAGAPLDVGVPETAAG